MLAAVLARRSQLTQKKMRTRPLRDQTNGVREAVTDGDGYFQFSFLPLGSFRVVISLSRDSRANLASFQLPCDQPWDQAPL